MKKIISFLIIFTLLFSLAALPTNAAVSETEGITALLKELEIMQGDENGDMMLDKKVSRAEFAKIAIAASPQKNSVALGLRQSPFRDVPYTQWYAPYVKAAVSANYVVGYLDATFRPDNTVTYEEAATIMLRVLGYDDNAFTDAYPYGQLSKAQSLDLLDDVNGEMGMEMTRYQVMYMVYNALNATTSSNSKLYSSHDCTLKENTDIISTADQDDTLGADKVFTSAGTYTKGGYFNDESAGMTGDLYIKNNKDAVAFVPDSGNNSNGYDSYFVYSVLSNASIVGYRNGHFEEIDIPNGATVYKNQQPTTYAAVKNELEMGDTLYVKRTQNGSVDYVTYDTNNLEGPVTVTGDGWMARVGAKQTSKVFRSGVESSASAVSVNDIVYYSEPLDVVFAYTDKVTGVYEKAAPTKDAPTTVTVSGKEYKIESVEAFNALSSSGSFKYGDTVTLLLGRTGEVAGVSGTGTAAASVSAGVSAGVTAGFVIEAGKKDFTNADNTVYTGYYVKVAAPDGLTYEYETKTNYDFLLCSAVTVKFNNRKATLSRTSNTSLSGIVNAQKGMIGGLYVSDNVKILDTLGNDKNDTPYFKKIYLQRLDGVTLTKSQIRYYSKNSAGEIDELILKDVTGDLYMYGVATKSNKSVIAFSKNDKGETNSSKTPGTYTIMHDGSEVTYGTDISFNVTGPVRFMTKNNNVTKINQIEAYNGTISSLTHTEAEISGQTYLLSDDVVIYRKNIGETYLKIPIEDAISGNYRMTAYYDKAQSSGGRIRIIIAQDK